MKAFHFLILLLGLFLSTNANAQNRLDLDIPKAPKQDKTGRVNKKPDLKCCEHKYYDNLESKYQSKDTLIKKPEIKYFRQIDYNNSGSKDRRFDRSFHGRNCCCCRRID